MIKWGTETVSVITYNSNDVKKVVYNNSTAWVKPFSYTTGTLPTGVASLTCTRSATSEPTASTGTISNNGTIYYEDSLYWTAEASTGYNVSVTHGSSSPVTVTSNVNGVSASGVTASRKSYTVTWKYQSSYGTWTTTTTTVYHGDTPTPPVSPSTVTSGSYRQVPSGWNDLSPVTSDKTIQMNYTQQYYISFSGTRCSCTSHSDGWYTASGSSTNSTWKANANCSFGGSSTEDTTTVAFTPNKPKTVSASAGYIYVTIQNGTGCSANYSTGIHPYGRTVTWTRSSGYAFDSSGTTTATADLTNPGGSYSKSCTYGYMTISATHCTAYSDSGCTTPISDGWKALSGNNYTVYFKAASSYSFGGSSGQDTTSVTKAVPNTFSASPGYGYYALSLTRCSRYSGAAEGWYAVGSTQTSYVQALSNYAFDSSGSVTGQCSATVPGTASKSANYAEYAVICTNCSVTSGNSSGWYGVNSTVSTTVTGNTTGSGCKWVFDSSGTSTSSISNHSVPYVWYPNANYMEVYLGGYNCSLKINGTSISSGWHGYIPYNSTLVGTANNYYSFSEGTTRVTTQTVYITSPGRYTDEDTLITASYYCVGGINGINCTCNVNANYYYDGYYVTQEWNHYQLQWTANSGYQFDGGATTQRITGFSAGETITATATAAGSWQELYPEYRAPSDPIDATGGRYTFESTSGQPNKGFGFFFQAKTKPTVAGQEFTFVASEMATAIDDNICAIYNIIYSAFAGGSKIRIYYRIFRGNSLTTPQLRMGTSDSVSDEISVSDFNNATSYANRITLIQAETTSSLSFYRDGSSGNWDAYKFVYMTNATAGCTGFYITKVETYS